MKIGGMSLMFNIRSYDSMPGMPSVLYMNITHRARGGSGPRVDGGKTGNNKNAKAHWFVP